MICTPVNLVVVKSKSINKYIIMKTISNLLLVSMLIITIGNLNARASNGESRSTGSDKAVQTLDEAVTVFDNVMDDPVNGIPKDLINASGGIVIFPGACRVAAGAFNGQGGKGIAMIRNENGSWSNPFFVIIREGNLGNKIGAQASDIVLLFKDRNDIKNIEKAEIALGNDIGVAAGPGNNGMASSTNRMFVTEVYSYQWSEGVFAGINLKGGILSYYAKSSDSSYVVENVNTDWISYGIEAPCNEEVNGLMEALTKYGE
jgi:lipid-binding SYLF domain-containing protein